MGSFRDAETGGGTYRQLDRQGSSAASQAQQVGSDVVNGFAAPFVQLGRDVADSYRRKTAEARAPLPSVGQAARDSISDLMDIPRIATDVVTAIPNALAGAVAHPAAGVISRAAPPMATHTEMRGMVPHTYVDGQMSPEAGQAAIEGDINTALQGVRPKGVNLAAARTASLAQTPVPGRNLTQQTRAVAPQMPVSVAAVPATSAPAAVVSRLYDAKKAAYDKVDASGFTFPSTDIKTLAGDLDAQIRAKGGPKAAKASPQADSMVGRIKALAGQPGGVTLSQLDEVRRDIWPLMMEAGGPDTVYGGLIRKGIDELISKSNAPFIQDARAANTRWAKADEVARRVRSAQLQAGRANSGENLGNAIRQKLSPMIDPMHSGQVQNLTGAEEAALAQIVEGDKTQNALRTWGNRLRNPLWTGAATTPATLLGLASGGPAGAATAAGLTAAGMQMAGQGLRAAAEQRTMRNVNGLMSTIEGVQAPQNAFAVSPRAVTGAAVVSAPAARQRARRKP